MEINNKIFNKVKETIEDGIIFYHNKRIMHIHRNTECNNFLIETKIKLHKHTQYSYTLNKVIIRMRKVVDGYIIHGIDEIDVLVTLYNIDFSIHKLDFLNKLIEERTKKYLKKKETSKKKIKQSSLNKIAEQL